MSWYVINNIETLDTPALVLYKDRIQSNIQNALKKVKDPLNLRPHVKTSKIAEVNSMLMATGITKFKCATIAEAEMLGMIKAPDVLLAYQPVGPKANRLLELTRKYTDTRFSCLIDDEQAALHLSDLFKKAGSKIPVYIDLNTGMNRTGITPEKAVTFFDNVSRHGGISVIGVHAYDGHIRDSSLSARQQKSDKDFAPVLRVVEELGSRADRAIKIITGGSPSFQTHVHRNVECSPGTFVFWDWGYHHQYPDEGFDYAALVVTRVVSVVENNIITTDLGHKSIASESPLPRVHFLNAADASAVGHSEEYLCLQVPDSAAYHVGDVLYGVPVHICPTVALYEKATVVEKNSIVANWDVVGRDRRITV